LLFERGYRNIQILFNGKEVKTFPVVIALLKTQEIVTDDDQVIHLRFLKDSSDFEVFLNGTQIDRSENSPSKVCDQLKWPIYITLSWYILSLSYCFFGLHLGNYLFHNPIAIINDFGIIYVFTSSFLVMSFLIFTLINLKKGNLVIYLIALLLVSGDLLFGVIGQIIIYGAFKNSFTLILFLGLILPVLFKSAVILHFIKNWRKYHKYSYLISQDKRKPNPELIDF